MSTRSGKRAHHNSFHEDIMKLPETDLTRSERKTRSKHTKENFDELNASHKIKKRNYVTYPATDEAGVDTADSKGKDKSTRVLRKNALKECNILTSTESTEPAKERKSTRSTRRTRKFEETQEEEQNEIKHTKPKKSKKKIMEQEVEEVIVTKKKSKKKKGRRSNSIVVEDIEVEAPSSLNKSVMSVDSFHSAAGSPQNCDPQVHGPFFEQDIQDIINHTPENKGEVRKTRSAIKFENNMLSASVKKTEPRRRKSSLKVNCDSELNHDTSEKQEYQEKTCNGEFLKLKSSTYDVTLTEDTKNSTIDLEKPNTSTRKSMRSSNSDKTTTLSKTNLDEKEWLTPTPQKKKKSIVKELFEGKSPDQDKTAYEKDSVVEAGHKGKKRKSSKSTDNLFSASKDKNKSEKIIEEDLQDNVTNKRSIIHAKYNLANILSLNPSPGKFTEKTKRKSVKEAFENDTDSESDFTQEKKKSMVDITFDITSSSFKSANEVSSPLKVIKENNLKRKSIINTTYEKDSDTSTDQTLKHQSNANVTFDKVLEANTTFDNNETINKQKIKSSQQRVTDAEINSTFDIDKNKLDTTFDKNSKSSISSNNSMITLDKSDDSRISITSDESKNEEIILNTTPVLIESSMEVSVINTTMTPTKETTLTTESLPPLTPLKREGTFTKDEPEVMSSPKPNNLLQTPTKRISLPSPGFTPFHINPSKEKSVVLNVTRSVEKRRSSVAELPRATRVMFCSPVNNAAVVAQNRGKVIKSNLKGSNKSFVFDESVALESRPARKRSYTQCDAEDARVKRKRLAGDLQQSVDRLSRPRTSSASAKLAEPSTPSKKPTTPSKKDAKLSRTKLPNFAALHQKQFDKMESLDECQERKARRAKQLLTPTGAVNVLERISPKDKAAELEILKEAPEKSKEASEKPKEPLAKPETPIKSLPTFKSLNPGYTRFGFKLNLDVNPFSIPSKTQPKPKENKPNCLNRLPILPSLAGATSIRREVAKQTVMREKSFTDKRNVNRTENRTVIKGVRTNRRFELQMRMREL